MIPPSWRIRCSSCQKQLPQARTPHEQTDLERHIAAKGRQIDALVYELYGLTEKEIAIVAEPLVKTYNWML